MSINCKMSSLGGSKKSKFPRKSIESMGASHLSMKTRNPDNIKTVLYKDAVDVDWTGVKRFLISNSGKPVSKVLSELSVKLKKFSQTYSAKTILYNHIKTKEDIGSEGGLYITNGILNYKRRIKYKRK